MQNLGIYGGWLTVNRYCNFRCPWCYALGAAFKPEDNMPLELAKSLIDLMHSLGIKDVVLIGGETLFWPYLFEIATYLKSLGMTSTVVTNGWLLGAKKFRDRIERSDITSLNISLKAASRQQYKDLTRFDGFDMVAEGLRAVSKWQHIRVETSFVISTAVIGNIVEMVKLAFDNGAGGLNISTCGPSINSGTFGSQFMPEPMAIVSAMVAAYERIHAISGDQFSLEGTLPACLWPQDLLATMEDRGQISFGCHFKTRSGLLFDRWGRVLSCNHLFDYPLGQFGVDFTDLTTFATFWAKPELAAFYAKMLEYPAQACISCTSFDKCGGGCPLMWFVHDPELVISQGRRMP